MRVWVEIYLKGDKLFSKHLNMSNQDLFLDRCDRIILSTNRQAEGKSNTKWLVFFYPDNYLKLKQSLIIKILKQETQNTWYIMTVVKLQNFWTFEIRLAFNNLNPKMVIVRKFGVKGTFM